MIERLLEKHETTREKTLEQFEIWEEHFSSSENKNDIEEIKELKYVVKMIKENELGTGSIPSEKLIREKRTFIEDEEEEEEKINTSKKGNDLKENSLKNIENQTFFNNITVTIFEINQRPLENCKISFYNISFTK